MENCSVVASLLLLGLFLISSPAEGYVRGYRYLDLSDQRLQSSPWRRLTRQQIMDAEIKTEENRVEGKEGEFIFRTPVTKDIRSRPMNKKFDDETPAGIADENTRLFYPTNTQNESEYVTITTRPTTTDTTNDGKRTDVWSHNMMSTITPQEDNNENDISTSNTASIIVILPLPSNRGQ